MHLHRINESKIHISSGEATPFSRGLSELALQDHEELQPSYKLDIATIPINV